jgi:hypothetical protein
MSSFSTYLQQQDPNQAVTLVLNAEEITLTAAEFTGKTVSQLFGEYGNRLGGDVSRITSYTVNNVVMPHTTQVRPGETVRGIVTSEGKG